MKQLGVSAARCRGSLYPCLGFLTLKPAKLAKPRGNFNQP